MSTNKKKFRKKKKYTIIAKTDTNDFKKWRTNNLLLFTNFLDKNYQNWRWFNVYCNKTKNQLKSYTKNNPPTLSDI